MCPYYRGSLTVELTSTTLGQRGVSLLQRFPQFGGHQTHYSTTLGQRGVSLLQRFPQFGGHQDYTGTERCVLITEVSSIWRSPGLHWDREVCPYYRGFLNLEVTRTTLGQRGVSLLQRFPQFGGHQDYTGTERCVLITEVSSIWRSPGLHWDREVCPYYRGFLNLEFTSTTMGHRVNRVLVII